MYSTEGTEASLSFSTQIKSALNLPTRNAVRLTSDTKGATKDEQSICPTPAKTEFETPRRSTDNLRYSLDEVDFSTSGDLADEGRHHILVTVECTIVSEEASLNEVERAREDVVGREWEWEQETETCSTLQSSSGRAALLADLDPALIGMIASGIR